jgi:hypothetical protein
MPSVIICAVFFAVSVLIHLIFCRLDKNKALKTKLFIFIAMANLIAFLAVGFYADLPLLLSCTAIFLMAIPGYLALYATTVLVSPSKRILQVAEMRDGATYEEIFKALEAENFIMTRLEELVQCGCASRVRDRYVLSVNGRAVAKFWQGYQKVCGRPQGG